MTDAAGRVIGVLCAMNSADLFRKILDVPVYGGQGYSNLIDKEGRYVVRSSLPVGTAKDACRWICSASLRTRSWPG